MVEVLGKRKHEAGLVVPAKFIAFKKTKKNYYTKMCEFYDVCYKFHVQKLFFILHVVCITVPYSF